MRSTRANTMVELVIGETRLTVDLETQTVIRRPSVTHITSRLPRGDTEAAAKYIEAVRLADNQPWRKAQ